MRHPRAVVLGAGRVAGGFVAPVLRAAGWQVTLVGRDPHVIDTIATTGGVGLRCGAAENGSPWIDGIDALMIADARLTPAINTADLLATSVGPSALRGVGRVLAPALRARLDRLGRPVNIITFENHRRAPELLALGLIETDASLAAEIGQRVGIGGAAVWRAVSRREVTPAGIVFDIDAVDECYVDRASLIAGIAPVAESIPGLTLAHAFDDRMIEKLWVFNAGHAAAAYLGWLHGCQTISAAMSHPDVRRVVEAVIEEARTAFAFHLQQRPTSVAIAPRSVEWIMARYADPALVDPVARVGREPRRKLAAEDRLIGPATSCLAAGVRPVALATAAAAALAYADGNDAQAIDLQREIELLGPEEVLAMVSTLDPREELTQLICERYGDLRRREAIRG